MFITEARANNIRQAHCDNSNDSIVEAERKKLVQYVRANCIRRIYKEDDVTETYDNNEVYKVKPNGMREFVRKLTPEEILENAREANETFEKYKHLFINK